MGLGSASLKPQYRKAHMEMSPSRDQSQAHNTVTSSVKLCYSYLMWRQTSPGLSMDQNVPQMQLNVVKR